MDDVRDGQQIVEAYNDQQYGVMIGFKTLSQMIDDAISAAYQAGLAARQEWLPIETAPKDMLIDAVVDGVVRIVRWGKTSHVPLYGFCLADQGAEDFDICHPTAWKHRPIPPTT